MAMTSPARTTGAPSMFDDRKKIEEWMKKSVKQLMAVERAPLRDDEKELHRSFILLLMKLVFVNWNGNRRGVLGTYYHRDDQKTGAVWSQGKEYLGHNIAAIAVDGKNNAIDFDFNHNDIFRSTEEHAESRLVRRLFNLTGLRSSWSLGDPYSEEDDRKNPYATTLSEVTIYTSLEPCAQCAGIMALASVKKVVYLQEDDGAMRVANVLYNLKPYGSGAEPIHAKDCDVPEADQLAQAYQAFQEQVRRKPFHEPDPKWQPGQKTNASASLSTFLCTDYALRIFGAAAGKFDELVRRASEWAADDPRRVRLEQAAEFVKYATIGGHRGTPH